MYEPIVAAGLIILGLILAAWYLHCAVQGRACAKWPTCQGIIEQAYVEVTKDNASYDGGRRLPSYWPEIEYSYTYRGVHGYGDRIYFGGMRGKSREGAEHWVRRYPPGRKVTVYVCPKDPNITVLEPGIPFTHHMAGIGAVLIIGLAIGLLVKAS